MKKNYNPKRLKQRWDAEQHWYFLCGLICDLWDGHYDDDYPVGLLDFIEEEQEKLRRRLARLGSRVAEPL